LRCVAHNKELYKNNTVQLLHFTKQPTEFSVSVAFDEVVLGFVSHIGGAEVLGAVDFGRAECDVLRKPFTLSVGRLAGADVAPTPRARTPPPTPGHVTALHSTGW